MASPTISAATLERLAKLLPRLASDHDGEVVATARAISRTLVAAGSDFHALAAILTADQDPFGLSDIVARAARAYEERPEPERPDPSAPDAPSARWGLPIWGVKKIEPWTVCASHCLQLDWTIPKASGGKFLTKDERDRLKVFERGGRLTNADAQWIETTVMRCHVVRDAWRSRSRTSPAPAPATV